MSEANPMASMEGETQSVSNTGAAVTVKLVKPIRGMAEILLREPSASDLRGVKILDVINMDTMSLEVVVPRLSMNGFTKDDFLNLHPKDMLNIGLQVSGFFAL
ncbi:phage tail assembly protein [Alteromonas sp. a30]|uniref:phage tail assembly protein n=1 Tax=Alteromonas sp. a30 TaxID=2730917 RepID=UPI00227DE043|nr:phage tail assembly protein [Alteromonas sp. a30]MCY7295093.1 phage tail assembly protein [Alteromonas sp. a30]